MTTINLSPKQDFLERVSAASPVRAISELIWNGIDAKATRIDVDIKSNGLDTIDEIVVSDNGTGINAADVNVYFGSIGDSWKRDIVREGGRFLHGKKGEGRFKVFAVGELVKWETVYVDASNQARCYTITGHASPCSFEYTNPEFVSSVTGTRVTICNIIDKKVHQLYSDTLKLEFAKVFAHYLAKNPDITLALNGEVIRPDEYYKDVYKDYLNPIVDENGREHTVQLEILEWRQEVTRGISICDDNGIELRAIDAKLKAKGINYTILVKSPYFRELDKSNGLELEESLPCIRDALCAAREKARAYFRGRKVKELATVVERWKREDIYPYDDRDDLTPVERAERQVFDIIGVNVEDYLPKFDDAEQTQKKFTFRLLAQAITNNPESLQKIITEVLELKKEEQDDLADLLKKTDLTNVIKSAKTVANRLDFLTGLQNLLFDKSTKKVLLERDQLHKILEKEAWIFDEDFALTASEASLEEVLKLHLEKLGKREDDASDVRRVDGTQGRVDLMFSLSNQPRIGQTDHLVVELKRPSKKIDSEVLSQIYSYAQAVSGDPRFDKTRTKWKFVAVSNEMDDIAKEQVNQANRPSGLYYLSHDNMIEVWAFEWTTVIGNAKARLEFINNTLSYNADRETARDYLEKKYEQYIPKMPIPKDESRDEFTNGA